MATHIARNAGIATALLLTAAAGLIQAHDAAPADSLEAANESPIVPAVDAAPGFAAAEATNMDCVSVDPVAVHPEDCI